MTGSDASRTIVERPHEGGIASPRDRARQSCRMRVIAVTAAAVLLLVAAIRGAASGDLRLADAVRTGRSDAVRVLLAERGGAAAVNAAEPDGTTPLHWAVRRGDMETTRMLLEAGANVHTANRYGVTPLSLAALNADPAMVDALLAAGADPNESLSGGQTVLMVAARSGNPAVIERLAQRGADVNAREHVLGENALIWAASENHSEAVRALVRHGGDPNAQSDVSKFPRRDYGDGKSGRFTVLPAGGWTPLMYAARQNALGALGALADVGADLDQRDPDGTTALILAIINAHYDAAALLLERGADPNVADVQGMTPFYAAIDMHTLDETPGRPAPRPSAGLDALDLASRLLAHGADVNAALRAPVLPRVHNPGDPQLGEGATPLMRAAKKADLAAIRLQLDGGANPTLTTTRGANAVMFASGFGGLGRFAEYDATRGSEADFIDAARLCLERGVDVNAVNDGGQTALHIAAAQRSDSFVKFLVDHGARLDIKDAQGRTPLDVALGVGARGRGGAQPAVRQSTAALLRQLMSDGRGAPR
jgi:ankyrin repeat protein